MFSKFLGFFGVRFGEEKNSFKAFAEALILAQEEERKRFSKELLESTKQPLQLITEQLNFTKQIATQNQQMISETLKEVRYIRGEMNALL